MTLREFIESPGVPSDDTYTGGIDEDLFFNCVRDETYLNRNLEASLFTRFRRKLYYDYGIGTIPLEPETFKHQFLFWGCIDRDSGLDSLPALFGHLSRVPESNRFIVMLNATDDTFTQLHAEMIPDSVKKVCAANCDVDHPKVQWYPLGRDGNNAEYFDVAPRKDKQQLAYCNFSLGTHPSRATVLDSVKNKEFVNVVEIDGHGLHSGYPMSNERFIDELNNHKFAVCPRGRGYDTLRMWDSLYLGVIPIVVREAQFHDHLTCLPILFLDSVDGYRELTREFLERKHAEMLHVEYDFSMLRESYWLRLFSEKAEALPI